MPHSCLLPEIAAGESVSLLLDLHVCRCVGRNPFPPATVTIDGHSASEQLTVQSGIAALTTIPDGPFVAGSKNPLTITATVVDGVSNPGKVTFVSTSKQVTSGTRRTACRCKPPARACRRSSATARHTP